MAELRKAILKSFAEVEGTLYVPTSPDNWRKQRPSSFNCSSFAQWLAWQCLGWSAEIRSRYDPPNARRLWTEFPAIAEVDLRPGDLLVYQSTSDVLDLHTMVFIGEDQVIGACEDAGCVTRRSAEYKTRWRLIAARRIAIE